MKPLLVGHSVADMSGTILSIDTAFGDLLDRRLSDIVGRSYVSITCQHDVARNIMEVQRVTDTQLPRMIRKRYVRADGALVCAEVQVSMMRSARFGQLTLGTIFLVDAPKIGFDAEALWLEAKRVHAVGMIKAAEMGEELFADIGWLTMLELYIAECEGRAPFARPSAALACDARVPRWLAALRDAGHVEFETGNPGSAQLTSRGAVRLETILREELQSRASVPPLPSRWPVE